MSELEGIGLIEKKRQGLGKPNRIYVKNFISSKTSQFKNSENHGSGIVRIIAPEQGKSQRNKTNTINSDISDTHPFLSDEMDERKLQRVFLRTAFL